MIETYLLKSQYLYSLLSSSLYIYIDSYCIQQKHLLYFVIHLYTSSTIYIDVQERKHGIAINENAHTLTHGNRKKQ